MIVTLALAAHMMLGQDFFHAADFFPLIPGTKWSYTDSLTPGALIEQVVKQAIVPNQDHSSEAGDSSANISYAPFFPVEVRVNGTLSGKPCFQTEGNTLLLVGNSPSRLIQPRPILKVGGDQVWEYDSDPISAIDPTPVHVSARSKPGPDGTYFGKVRKTFILTTDASVGGKNGLKIHQKAIYAEGIGMVQFDEDGTAGGKPIKHSRKLVNFQPVEGIR